MIGALLIAAMWSGTTAEAATCPGMSEVTTPATAAAAAASTVCLINAVRADQGLRPLRWSPKLAVAAALHSQDMADHLYFSHTSRDGRGPLDRIRASGYLRRAGAWTVGECLGAGFEGASTPLATVTAWLKSPAHRVIVLGREFRQVGIGIATADRGLDLGGRGAVFTADFGRR